MSDLFLCERIGANQMICVSELNLDALECDEINHRNDSGNLYLYLIDETPVTGGIRVLARVTSYEAAFVLFEILSNREAAAIAA
jgi:hypothetical protein